ncbi:SCO family protein [Lysobacter sp. Root604]|uniref:SCO family protein n=1 Tax=Lysobacter sp. Root604 TaxID=1736568 RepID=UPI0006F91271|nr:SCO family protein [Lysobacter sp. Root604]KRA19873.1 hypothetical protein ASD69_00415 [Lysobacter sp. Root604]
MNPTTRAPARARRRGARVARWALACWMVVCLPVPAQDDPHAAHRAALARAQGASPTRVALPGTRLSMRDGSAVRLQADSFDDRIVVIDFVFTQCTTICPALTAVMASVQRGLEPGADDWLLVSVSVDPAHDTPARMDAYARNVGAGRNWWWLTGAGGEVDRSLRAFGLPPGRPQDHAPMVLVGHPASGQWLRWVGMPSPKQLLAAVASLRASATRPGPQRTAHAQP